MAESLYPTFNLPSVAIDTERSKKKSYKQSLYFDYEAGDFVLDASHRPVLAEGREAFCQWCLKQCATERGTKLAYSDKIGVEIVKAAIVVVKGWVESAGSLQVVFVVKGHEWDEDTLSVTY